jgi:tRNA nucleotidyltransferase/poly(A) polymerase
MDRDQAAYGCSSRPYDMDIPHEYDRPIHDLSDIGLPLVVGGAVRDSFLHADNKDIDLEVYHVGMDDMIAFLHDRGYHVDEVGRRFGVLKVKGNGVHDLDVAVPRTENNVSAGHRGFTVDTDKNLLVPEAASRRDFTINAMAYDPIAHRLIDPYGGERDLRDHVLRAVGPRFAEDPLRVLRGFQIASRFDLHMDDDTVNMCRGLRGQAASLSGERVREEWVKFYNRSSNPTAGTNVLRQTGWDDTISGLHDALRSHDLDGDLIRAWHMSDDPVIRAGVLGRHVDADDRGAFLRATMHDHDMAGAANRLTKVRADDLMTVADRREWEWKHRGKKGPVLADISVYGAAINDNKLTGLTSQDQGVIKPFVNGDDVISASTVRPGAWTRVLLDDLRHEQYQGRVNDRESALALMRSRLTEL